MQFYEALAHIENGLAMRRAAWPDSEGYLKVLPGMKFVWKIVLVPNPNAGNFIFSLEDFNANDWQEFVNFDMPVNGVVVDAQSVVA